MSIRIERVVVTGGRKFSDGARIEADLRALLSLGLRRVAHGAARGADMLVDQAWCIHRLSESQVDLSTPDVTAYTDQRGRVLARYIARWEDEGSSAGPRRNVRMLEAEKPDLVLAYPDENSRGTWQCVREAVKRGITCAVWVAWAHSQNRAETWVAAGLARARLRAPTMTATDFAPRIIVATPPAHMDARELLEVLGG